MVAILRPKFSLGQIVATPGALEALQAAKQTAQQFLFRHAHADWGIVDETDKGLNDQALEDGSRILSAYALSNNLKIWILTEAENHDGRRASTCVMLPSDY